MATIFSRIIAREIPSYRIAEDNKHYAFLDINPITKGHTLVVPKCEVDYIYDLTDVELADLHIFAKRIAEAIKKATKCKRIAVVVIGLEVPHAHIHLIPINSESDVNFKNKLSLTPEEFAEIQQSIASQM